MKLPISENFKSNATKAILSIIIFTISYFTISAISIALSILCIIAGIFLIILKPMFITLVLGIGLASIGFFILYFLVKFIFKKYTVDRSHLTEITEIDEPVLFNLIKEIVYEVETEFPKKIYFSNDVNASVFYDSTILSMFLPVRKNLQIGLGLMNSVTVSEFKAILSHEFGHFSQSSMKIGSYVYNVNQIIYNMLFDNSTLNDAMIRWANFSGYFTFFVKIATWIIETIQWLLKKLYEFVNINYLALSREMEFHADEIAANVTGYKPLKDSLLRIDFANYSLNEVFQFYNNKIEENKTSKNIYEDHRIAMQFLAKENDLIIENDLPIITIADINRYNKSKLNIKDQWASHPSTEDRIIALEKTGIIKSNYNQSLAISLLSDSEKTLQIHTKKLFSEVKYTTPVIILNNSFFSDEFKENYLKNKFSSIYNGYYDSKNPFPFEINSTSLTTEMNINFDDLYSKDKIELVYDYISLINDKNILEQINSKAINLKTFDYNGLKYNSDDAFELLLNINDEEKLLKSKITENDINIYNFFLKKAKLKNKESELINHYNDFFIIDKEYENKIGIFHEVYKNLEFINVTTPVEIIISNFKNNITPYENDLKKEIHLLLNHPIMNNQINLSAREQLLDYISNDWLYFSNNKYLDENLHKLFSALNIFAELLNTQYFITKKTLLEFQTTLLNEE